MRRRGLGTVLVGFGTTLALVLFPATGVGGDFWRRILSALEHQTHEVPHAWLVAFAWRILHNLLFAVDSGLPAALAAATSVATLGIMVARWMAGSSVRAGKADPLQRLRAHPRLVRALTVLPAVLFALPWVGDVVRSVMLFGARSVGYSLNALTCNLLTTGIVGALVYAASRAGMRGLLAPVEIEEVVAPRDPGDIVFSAVAVTARTRGAVAAFAAASVAMVAWTLVAPSNAAFSYAIAAYIAAAMTAPFVLRRVSRIAVGLDGVWVRDASHAHFLGYRDLEGARARGADLELVGKGGRAVLRLQMHGDDAGRRDEVLARLQDAIVRSRAEDTRGAEMLVQAMPARQIVASAGGDARYRLPSISRQQLWDLVESSATDGATRTAAAEALAIRIDHADRARLRVAAHQCAEPRVRIALAALADEEAAAEAAAAEEAGGAAAQR